MSVDFVLSVRSKDDVRGDNLVELVSESVGCKCVSATETNEVTLVDAINTGQIRQTGRQHTLQ